MTARELVETGGGFVVLLGFFVLIVYGLPVLAVLFGWWLP